MPESLHRVMAGVLRYMVEHPDAKDTLEGIGTWWRPDRTEWPAADLQQALAVLEARGWIVVREVVRGVRLYAANSRHLDEMRRYLAAGRGGSQGSSEAGDKE